jgi:hypothetical protein
VHGAHFAMCKTAETVAYHERDARVSDRGAEPYSRVNLAPYSCTRKITRYQDLTFVALLLNHAPGRVSAISQAGFVPTPGQWSRMAASGSKCEWVAFVIRSSGRRPVPRNGAQPPGRVENATVRRFPRLPRKSLTISPGGAARSLTRWPRDGSVSTRAIE